MTIEEKAKRYDEAIKMAQAKMEEAKVFDYDDEQTAYTIRLTTTDIFPELKEPEDELTWLTKYIEEEAYSLSMDIRDNEDRIKLKKLQRSLAWLEKHSSSQTKE